MSINHYSTDIPEQMLWWTQQPQQQQPPQPIHSSSPNQLSWLNSHTSPDPTIIHRFNLNNQDQDEDNEDEDENNNNSNFNLQQPPMDDDQGVITITSSSPQQGEDQKEPMFEKPLTPSDVGKLNRLVIPKQHAEKYFPLGGGGGGDSGESKGLLLSFEDESGKCWRFRYSYWNSSQSYVLTKGWSRYVKENRLDAGDVVLFERHRADSQRFFIGWRRRQLSGSVPAHVSRGGVHLMSSDGWTRGFYSAHQPWPYQPDHCLDAAGRGSQSQKETTPVGNGSSCSFCSSSRVLRLFGVNMECQPDNDDSEITTPECSHSNMSSNQRTPPHHFHHHHHQPSSYPYHHMQDVNQMRNLQG